MIAVQTRINRILAVGILCVSACSPGNVSTPLPTAPVQTQTAAQMPSIPTETATPLPAPVYIDIPGAQSISVAAAGDGGVYVAYGQRESIFVTRSDGKQLSFAAPVKATGSKSAYVMSLERPALAVNSQGDVGVAWLEHAEDHSGTKIWFSISRDGGQTFSDAILTSTEQGEEIVMAHVNLDEAGNPLLFWIKDTELRYARSFDQGKSFDIVETIGAGSCDCCQPSTVVIGERVIVAYRNLVQGDPQGDIRDIVSIFSSDGGRTFEEVVPISDKHWYLNACPIAGPSLVHHEGQLYAAWMDARTAAPGDRYDGNIWFATSANLAQSFSANQRVDEEESLHDTLPVLAVGPDRRIHLVWEGREPAAIYYRTSDDSGKSFSPAVVLARDDSKRGLPGNPSTAVDTQGQVYVVWLDRQGARVASWKEQP